VWLLDLFDEYKLERARECDDTHRRIALSIVGRAEILRLDACYF